MIAFVNGVDVFYEAIGEGEPMVLTHGSWTDGTGWGPSVGTLAERFRVITWDRRGHSRSEDTDHPGSRAEDAADLAALIEHIAAGPVHLIGSSYGAIVTLTTLANRPDLVTSVAIHEPPLLPLLEATAPAPMDDALAVSSRQLQAVAALIEAGDYREAAELFIEDVALGPGSWDLLPKPFRDLISANAPSYLDELRDPTALQIDTAALARSTAPILLTHGTASPIYFPAIVDKLAQFIPAAHVEVIPGAGHIPHATHPALWTATLAAFHDEIAVSPGRSRR